MPLCPSPAQADTANKRLAVWHTGCNSKGMAHTIYFETREYEMAHGKSPRGTGNWGFSPYRTDEQRFARPENIFWHNGTYAEGKKAAKARAKTGVWGDVYDIYVCS